MIKCPVCESTTFTTIDIYSLRVKGVFYTENGYSYEDELGRDYLDSEGSFTCSEDHEVDILRQPELYDKLVKYYDKVSG
jgi:hypothetical protein